MRTIRKTELAVAALLVFLPSQTWAGVAPTTANQSITAVADTEFGPLLLSITDPDTLANSAAMTVTIVSGPAHGTLESYHDRYFVCAGHNNQMFYRPAAGYVGADSFTWKCFDGTSWSGTATVSITVNANTIPTALNTSSAVGCYGRSSVTLSAKHADNGQTITYTLVSPPSHGTMEMPVPGKYSMYGSAIVRNAYYTSAKDYVGSDSFTYKVNDGFGDSNVATASITVSAAVPRPENQSEFVRKDESSVIKAAFSGGGGSYTCSMIKVTDPAHGTVTVNGTSFVYTPTTGFNGPDTFTWKMNYSNATTPATDTATVTCSLTVKDGVNGAAYDQKLVVLKDTATTASFSQGHQGSCPTPTFNVVAAPAHGSVTVLGRDFIYTPTTGYTGPDTFAWKMNDGAVDSNTATCRILVRAENSRGGMTVLLVVKDTLLPEISAEVARLQRDLINEGYAAKIKAWPANDAAQLWSYLVSEYDAAGQFLAGAILIGNLPTATGLTGETTDYAFMNMVRYRDNGYYNQHIWVSRIWALGFVGGEVKRAKWALDANHGYRTGAHRLPYGAYWDDRVSGGVNEINAQNTLIVWPTIEHVYPMDAFRKGGEFENSEIHSDGAFIGFDGHPSQLRYSIHSSCGPGRLGGPINKNMCTYGGGMILGVGSTDTSYAGMNVVMDNIDYFMCLAVGDTLGNGITRPKLNPYGDYDRNMFYGDLSLPAKAAPANQIPAIGAFTSDVASGSAPLTVNFSVTATDPDGAIGAYEWFMHGFNGGYDGPVSSGASMAACSWTYALPHRYPAEVQVVDNWKARAWTSKNIVVGPESGEPIRVNCGKNLTYYTPAEDYADAAGQIWLHDQAFVAGTWGYSGGSAGLVTTAVAGTEDDMLYQKYRTGLSGNSFAYKVPVANGSYTLRLGFADMKSTAAGVRVVDVDVEGAAAVTGLDVYALKGAKNVHIVEIPANVSDGELTLTVKKNAAATADAFLNCFEVIPGSVTPVKPTITSGLTASATVGQPFSYTTTASGTAPITFGASGLPAGLSRSGAVIGGTPTAAGTSNVTLTANNVAGSDSRTLVLTVAAAANSAPVVSSYSPASPAVVAAGSSQPFSVDAWDADGDPLSYAWNLDGATAPVSSDLFTYSPTAADAGSHSIEVTVSDGRGGSVKQTWSVTVTVPATPPSITTQPVNKTVTAGQTAMFTVVAAGTAPLSYQWKKNGVNVSGATSASYTTPATVLADSGSKFRVTVSNSAGSVTSSEATLTVNPAPADLPVVTLTAYDAWAAEPGSDTGRFRLYRSNCTTTAALTVKYTMSGSATNGSDYQSLSGSVTIAAGSRTAYVYVTPLDDTKVEGAESVTMTLSTDAAYVSGSPSSATVALLDNETPIITVTASDAYASEPGSDKGSFRVARGGATAAAVTVKYAMSGTATNGSDYQALTGSVVIPAGKTSAYVYVTALDDTLVEDQETVVLTVSADASYQVGKTSVATVKLLDDEVPILTVKATDAVAAEPSADKGTFTITRSGKLNVALTVTYKMSGVAKSGTDYVAPSGTVTLASGATSATVTITAIDDTLVEGRESVTLALVDGSAYQLGSPSSATLYVYDDEKPYVTIKATDTKAYEAGLDSGEFTVSCVPAAKAATTVGLTITGTATSGSDYQALPNSVTIAAGASSAKVAVRPLDDAASEGSESVKAALVSGATYQVGSPSSATVYITSNE